MAQTMGSRSTDEERLAELGYKQELTRAWSGFSNLAISFHDHLDPGRVLHDLRPSVEQRRPRRDLVGLAPDLDRDPDHRLLQVVRAWWLLSARHTIKGPVRTVEFDDGLGIADPEQERVG